MLIRNQDFIETNQNFIELKKLLVKCDMCFAKLLRKLDRSTHRFERMYEIASLGFAIIEIKAILDFVESNPQHSANETLSLFETYLSYYANEIIDVSYLSYTKNPYHPLTILCYKIACLLSRVNKESGKIAYQYLIPTLLKSENFVTLENLSELRLDQFILSDQAKYGIPIMMLDDYIRSDNKEERKKALWNPYIPTKIGKRGIPVSDKAFKRLIHHSVESREYYRAYIDMISKKTGTIGRALEALAENLRKGGASGTGREGKAGAIAVKAIIEFRTWLQSLNDDTRVKVEDLLSSKEYKHEPLIRVLDIMAGDEKEGLTCVEVGASKIESILDNPDNHEFLYGYDSYAANKILFLKRKIFIDKYEARDGYFTIFTNRRGRDKFFMIRKIILQQKVQFEKTGNINAIFLDVHGEELIINIVKHAMITGNDKNLDVLKIAFSIGISHKKIFPLLISFIECRQVDHPLTLKSIYNILFEEINHISTIQEHIPQVFTDALKYKNIIILEMLLQSECVILDLKQCNKLVTLIRENKDIDLTHQFLNSVKRYIMTTSELLNLVFENKVLSEAIDIKVMNEFLDFFLIEGGEFNAIHAQRPTYISSAVVYGRPDIVKLLKEKGCVPNRYDIILIHDLLHELCSQPEMFEIRRMRSKTLSVEDIISVKSVKEIMVFYSEGFYQDCVHRFAFCDRKKGEYTVRSMGKHVTRKLHPDEILRFIYEQGGCIPVKKIVYSIIEAAMAADPDIIIKTEDYRLEWLESNTSQIADQRTLLMHAVVRGDIRLAKRLLDLGVSVAQEVSRESAMTLAIKSQNIKMVDMLLKYDLNYTQLHEAYKYAMGIENTLDLDFPDFTFSIHEEDWQCYQDKCYQYQHAALISKHILDVKDRIEKFKLTLFGMNPVNDDFTRENVEASPSHASVAEMKPSLSNT